LFLLLISYTINNKNKILVISIIKMASIPNNGYAAVMAGTNVYTGSNFYGSDCPKTPIVPVDPDDLCNKLYVDTIAGGGTVVSVNAGNNISITGTIPSPIVNLQSPLTATLALGTQNLTAVNGLFSSTINAQGLLNAQYFNAGVADATAQVLTAVGGDAVIGLASNNLATGNGHLLEISANNSGPALIEHQSLGVARDLAISSQGNITINTASVVSTSGSFKPATVLDTFANAAGTAGQVLSSLGGAGTKWITNAAGFGDLNDTLALGNTATGSYATITLNDTDTGGLINPILTLNNTNATGSVCMEVYKNKPTAGTNGDILFNQSVYGKDSGVNKQEYTRITHTIRDATGGTEDGSIELSAVRAGTIETFLQINGVDNEVNCLKTLDMGNNNISTSTGNMAIVTTASTGAGTLQLNSKAATNITATTGGINLTANSGATIQANTTGAISLVGTTQLSMTSSTGVFGITQELHYGRVSTPYIEQEFRSVYQPLLTATTNTFPVAEITRDGQQVIFINSGGDGANELTPIPSPDFSISSMIYVPSISSYIAGGYNHSTLTCEVRCASSVANLQSSFTSFVKFLANPTYYVNVVYQSPLFPNLIAVGGFFSASVFGSYDGTNPWPSPVENFVVIDTTTSVIFPISMLDAPNPTGYYGVNAQVKTITAQSNTYYTPADAPIFILGGDFTDIISNISPLQPAFRTAVFCPQGTINPFLVKWLDFIAADAPVNFLWCLDDRVVFAGQFLTLGSSTVNFLAFNDNTTPFFFPSLINGFTPPASVNSGYQLSGNTCYFGCNQDASLEYPVYTFDLGNMATTPTVVITTLPALATGFLSDNGSVLDFIVGHNSGSGNYCYKVQIPDYLDLNGLTYPQNCGYDNLNNAPTFFREPALLPSSSLEYWQYIPTTGAVSITTTDLLPFVSATAPANNWKTITLASRNNFATGTVVQLGTDDQRIVVLASLGATFSN
jgi:hypothetical protein